MEIIFREDCLKELYEEGKTKHKKYKTLQKDIAKRFIKTIDILKAAKMTTNKLIPFIATHPGEVIKDEIEARNISLQTFASLLGVESSYLDELISGKRSITVDTASLLERELCIPASFWLHLQSQYNLDCRNIEIKRSKEQYTITEQPIEEYACAIC